MILQSHPSDTRSWMTVSGPACLLALPAADAARLDPDELGRRLSSDDGFRAVLELLVAEGIAAAPSFALLDGDAAVARVVLRGEATVTVVLVDPEAGGQDAGALTISGRSVATWSERVLEGAAALRLEVPGAAWTMLLEGSAPPVPPRTADSESSAPVTEPTAAAVGETTLVPSGQAEAPTVAEPAAEPSPSAVEPATVEPATVEPYDFLFGDTIYRTQAGLSVRIPNPDPERPGDHDGRTMLSEELGLAGRGADLEELAAPDITVVAPIPGYVPASGADEPGPGVDDAAESGPRPTLRSSPTLQLERADGGREPLTGPVLIGRAPSATGAAASGIAPRLITIADDRDISRSHLRVAVEGDAVVVTDLASKNGTLVTLPGGSPRKLRGGEPTVVIPGTLIDLGGGVTFLVRED